MTTAPDVATLEHVAGAFSLEFVNSATGIARAGYDWLSDPVSAQAWAGSLGLRLDGVSAAELTGLRALREAVHRVFRAVADDTAAPSADLDAVTSAQAVGLSGWPLEQHDGEFRRAWPAVDTAASLAARAADDAIELLRHARLDRIGVCERCGWLFLDISRNGRRRWCSMLSCGAKEKARRHYERAAVTTRE
jgi:predicted RNA-binding Zn ribbon-like protein